MIRIPKGREWIIICLTIVIIALGIVVLKKTSNNEVDNNTVTIVLSPHFDDAVLSLGGILAHESHQKIVATFFTEAPEIATSTAWDTSAGFADSKTVHAARVIENEQALKELGDNEMRNFSYVDYEYGRDEDDGALQAEISKDIQQLIASVGDKQIRIYGPAYFTEAITHPDHALIHRAFIDVAKGYPRDNVSFFIYEDFPYVVRFNRESVVSLEKNLENTDEYIYTKVPRELRASEVSDKITVLKYYTSQLKAFQDRGIDIVAAVEEYTKNRCGINKACEMVYQIPRY
jgi:LmbE family N-acetylglucosaminyl deacetylase